MPLVIKTEDVEKKAVTISPHLAITHNELQGGAANGRNVALLLKSDVELTPEIKTLLKGLLGEDVKLDEVAVEKASYEQLRTLLSQAAKDIWGTGDNYFYVYVEDFDTEHAVFSTDDGLVFAPYTVNGSTVTLGDKTEVTRVVSYKAATDGLSLSDSSDAQGLAPKGVYSLIVKSFDSIANNDKIKAILKSKYENEVKNVEQEIQKALAPVQAELTKARADLESVQKERDALKASVDAIEKAQADAKSAARLEEVKAVVKDEAEAVELHKSIDALPDEAFNTVLKSFKVKADILEQSGLFKQASGDADSPTGESNLMQMLKSKYEQANK